MERWYDKPVNDLRWNDLCTKEVTGQCAMCDALAERERFITFWFKGVWLLKLLNVWLLQLPLVVIASALSYLAIETFDVLLHKDDFSLILTYYLAATALSISFTSMTFAYARAKPGEDSEELVVIGELFLYASLSLIVALLITWLCFTVRKQLKTTAYYETFDIPLRVVAGFGNLYLLAASRCLYIGIKNLEERLKGKIGKLAGLFRDFTSP